MLLPILTVFLPLFAALFVFFGLRVISERTAQIVTTGCTMLSAAGSWILFVQVALQGHPRTVMLGEWLGSGTLQASWALRVDALTAVMLIVVTTVSALVHLYSIGYMSEDPSKRRFMGYLSLFTFFMLMLVTADNLAQIFLGWEGVGLSSYLLIGFWYTKPEANAAAMKAFIVNRVGDFGFALGIFSVFTLFGTIHYTEIFSRAAEMNGVYYHFLGHSFHAITVTCLLLFVGAMGKSAQLGLHTWLPDAMEGPTPVSALIHAATMVTAGVFLVARFSPLFEYAPLALSVVTLIGAATAFFAATIGLVQTDIKRVIAYSTCSQLGYMFFACGVSAYGAGIFHLMTHGFFKALLFLGAGSVIHAMHHEQDMRNMGGLAKKIPVTYWMMTIGSLALAGIGLPGIFGFAGFYSKDVILESAYASHSPAGMLAFVLGTLAALMTAFYSWRLLFLTFHGKTRADHHTYDHAHESPKIMLIPLFVLAFGAIFAGYAGEALGMVDPDGHFWQGAIFVRPINNVLEMAHHVPLWVKWLPLVAGIGGIVLAWLFYIRAPQIPGKITRAFAPVYDFLLHKWYFDELYDALFVQTARRLGRVFWIAGDQNVIDGLGPNGIASLASRIGKRASQAQTGYLYHYAFVMLVGLVLIISWVLVGTHWVGVDVRG